MFRVLGFRENNLRLSCHFWLDGFDPDFSWFMVVSWLMWQDGLPDSLTEWLINRLTIPWTLCLTYSFTNLLTDWLINWLTGWLNHWLTDWLTPWLIWQKIIYYILQLSWNNLHNLMIVCSRMSIMEHFLHWWPPVTPFTPLTGWRPCPL